MPAFFLYIYVNVKNRLCLFFFKKKENDEPKDLFALQIEVLVWMTSNKLRFDLKYMK